MNEEERCRSALDHNHGVSRCTEPAGHPGRHEGVCDSCWEDGEYCELTWSSEDPRATG